MNTELLAAHEQAAKRVTEEVWRVTKTYGAEQGFSTAFRQWRAGDSHCRFLHGYSLSFAFTFEGPRDGRGWVIGFGDLKELKESLKDHFDHKTLIAKDDPLLPMFYELHASEGCDLLELEGVGCEAFAQLAAALVVEKVLSKEDLQSRGVRLVSVKVSEHLGNSVEYYPPGHYVVAPGR